MVPTAIRCEGVGKRYQLGESGAAYDSLRDAIVRAIRAPLAKRAGRAPKPSTDFWALSDVSFDVAEGEVVGIIGRNGAGKSTLLKVLSRITEPTRGRVAITGRVGALLEVGTGFHPELTGRENIFLNGAILGMKRQRIVQQFDAIVDFAEIAKFLDTPVKYYSSGMFVRLAFAVAAHLEPEILVVDEVLAVGDAAFQKKCLGKMDDVASRDGRTVLFISHNMDAIRTLCTRGILLRNGAVAFDGKVDECVARYLDAEGGECGDTWTRRAGMPERSLAFERVMTRVTGAQPSLTLEVIMDLRSNGAHKPAFVAIDICNASGTQIMQAIPRLEPFVTTEPRDHKLHVDVALPPLIPGSYSLGVWAGSHNTETLDAVQGCTRFEVVVSPQDGRTFPHTADQGNVVPFSRLIDA